MLLILHTHKQTGWIILTSALYTITGTYFGLDNSNQWTWNNQWNKIPNLSLDITCGPDREHMLLPNPISEHQTSLTRYDLFDAFSRLALVFELQIIFMFLLSLITSPQSPATGRVPADTPWVPVFDGWKRAGNNTFII